MKRESRWPGEASGLLGGRVVGATQSHLAASFLQRFDQYQARYYGLCAGETHDCNFAEWRNRRLLIQINVPRPASAHKFLDRCAEARSVKHGIEASMGVDLPMRRTLLPMKRDGGLVPFHPDHPEDNLGFARGGPRGSLITVLPTG